ncbi:ABC transporter ATP-binding protein [Brucella pituitosa]|uniref:ABC transporter ATP-binding protein n=1 Tax=Brucella pituitosa TaxID=571256 RepID=UPI000D00D4C6|nr:polyamine ABC transporter ATP-binding protein [Ochrobactrum sp. MYb68]
MIGQQMSLTGIQKQYGSAWAVQGLDLEVSKGEFLSIVGPSGSGKTSLLNMIAGFEMPSAGQILIGGERVTHLPPNKRQIGMVFQKYALFPHLTVRQNVSFPLEMRTKMSRLERERRVCEMLDLVELSDFGERLPSQLSGGQQQRVAVARALVFNPPVILMDEPLGALDKKLRENMQLEIKRIQERLGATVIYVTHDQEEALTMSDRVAVMQNGQLEQIDTPEGLYRNPVSSFVADFIGTMNFLPAVKIGEKVGVAVLRIGEHTVIDLPITSLNTSLSNQDIDRKLTLAFRPEHVSLEQGGNAASSAIQGEIEADIFMGSTNTYVVKLNDCPDAQIRVQSAANTASAFKRGDRVSLRLNNQSVHAFASRERDAA